MDNYWAAKEFKESKVKASTDEDKTSVEVVGNHIYFYNGVDFTSALELNKVLQSTVTELLYISKTNGFNKPVLHLHINSGGGYITAGISIMDSIVRLKKDIDVYTYVEGRAASAATFISLVGTKRFITPNSLMLIHQLSGGSWGKYSEMVDSHKNNELMMNMIKNFYNEYTKIPKNKIDKILSHDLFWDAKKCLEFGLVDKILD
jgi:ATP-dependent Clp protease protease subunit